MKKVIFLLTIIFSIGISYACRCEDQDSTEEAYKNTPVIIYGKVINKTYVCIAETINKDSLASIKEKLVINRVDLLNSPIITKVEIEIIEKFKGRNIPDTITVFTPRQGSSCGYNRFNIGQEFVIYGFQHNYIASMFYNIEHAEIPNTIWTNHCTRTTEFIDEEIKALKAIEEK